MSWDAIADADLIEKLTAENARLRGEVEVAYASRNEAVERANQLEFHDVPERDAEIRDAMHDLRASEYVSETRRTELLKCIADLARVTGERDAAASSLMAIAQWTEDDGDMNSLRAYARNRSIVAACAPPASGEEG